MLRTPASYTNPHRSGGFVVRTSDLTAYRGRTVRVHFRGREDGALQNSLAIGDAALRIR